MISIKKNQAGQSLMEMLIAIFILIVALTASVAEVEEKFQKVLDRSRKKFEL